MDYASVFDNVSSVGDTGKEGKLASTEDPKSAHAKGGRFSWAARAGGLLRYFPRMRPISIFPNRQFRSIAGPTWSLFDFRTYTNSTQ